ncbi:MAG: hypothetical protein AAGG44_04300 [Planctomycetota bacterium]
MRYDPEQSYDWNFELGMGLGKNQLEAATPLAGADWRFCGLPVASPLGIAAGPLLNGGWVLHYANQGFDILTYKTVRSRSRACFAEPNLVPIVETEIAPGAHTSASKSMAGSWGISFGMPSREPDFWRRDIEDIRPKLGDGRLLVVSVVASPEPDWTLEQVADDYAQCACWAADAGADVIELNLSCPNVASQDGQLFRQPDKVSQILQRVFAFGCELPKVIKIGHLESESLIADLVQVCATHQTAISMTNCLASTIEDENKEMLWGGESRGIGGEAIRKESIAQIRRFANAIRQQDVSTQLVGIGGISTAEHVDDYLAAGANSVQLATSAMRSEDLGHRLKSRLQDKT